MNHQTATPFQLPVNKNMRWLASAGEHLLGLRALEAFYRQRRGGMSSREFLRYTLETLDVDYSVVSGSIDSIPDTGPVVVVANHPFGAIEGVVLAELLMQRRADVQILANQYLHRIDELSGLFIGVDVFRGSSSARINISGLKQAVRHLEHNGVLLVFPAGEVSSLQLGQKQVTDREWNRIVGMMLRKTGACSVPVYIEGANGPLFQIAGLIHPRFRTLLLAREMLKMRHKSLKLHIGESVDKSELKSLPSDSAIANYLRLNTYLLAGQVDHRRRLEKTGKHGQQAIAAAEGKCDLLRDIEALGDDCVMVRKDDLVVYCATAERLPHVLPEIGRLREITFRAVGEGTGRSRDLDAYDRDYLHLFIWNEARLEIAGAYRLGLVDQLRKQRGIRGLYSRSLFRYRKKFINSLGPSIELGRSFICEDYQRSLNALLMLWKGIGAYIARNPRYTTLFGPVSISGDYSELSRNLMSSFLEVHHYDSERAVSVKPTHPLKKPRNIFWTRHMLSELGDSQLISKLIYRMEGDKGLPVLIRQYLNMCGRLVCFNVDREFGHALDGMIIVNLLDVPEKVLGRYMGKDAASAYLAHKESRAGFGIKSSGNCMGSQ